MNILKYIRKLKRDRQIAFQKKFIILTICMSNIPQTSFSHICQAVLGRPQLRANWPWKSSSSSFIQIFSDFQKMNIPWWKLGKMAGIFFFYDHILINIELLSQATSENPEALQKSIEQDNFTRIETPNYLKELFLNNIQLQTDNWVLYSIKEAFDSERLVELLHKMKCPSITSFQGEQVEKKPLPSLSYNYFEQASYQSNEELLQKSLAFDPCPGLYYQSLIPSERLSTVTNKCWLFQTPEDLS